MSATSQQARAKSSSKKTRHVSILTRDIRLWLSQRVLALSIAIGLIIFNIVYWILFTGTQLLTKGPQATLAQFISIRSTRLSAPFLFGHNNIPLLLAQLCRDLVFVRTLPSLMVNATLALILLGMAEVKLGKLRMLIISAISTLMGTILGLATIGSLSQIISNMHWITRLPIHLSPFTLFIGVFMAAAAFESLLWHRRMLVLGYVSTSAVLLYSGNPGDYCTLFSALSGHIIGILLLRASDQPTYHSWRHSSSYEIRRLFAMTELVMASGPILALSSRSHAGILTLLGLFMSPQTGTRTWIDQCMSNRSATSCLIRSGLRHAAMGTISFRIAIPMFTMILLAWGLLRGKRIAALATIVINALTGLLATVYFLIVPMIVIHRNISYHHNAVAIAFILTALPPLCIAFLLCINLRHFHIDTPAERIRMGLAAILVTLIATAVGYVTFGLVMPQAFRPRANLLRLISDLPGRWMPVNFAAKSHAMLIARTSIASLVTHSVGIVLWTVLFVIFFIWLRSTLSTNEVDQQHASDLVEIGGESMSFMTTWEDNHYWFSPSGRSAIAYRVRYGVALSLTGPFGDEREYEQDLRDFIQFCEHNSWSPAFYAVHKHHRDVLASLGCHDVQVGTEMLINPSEWQTRGKKWQDIRTAINKAKRDGIIDVVSTYNEAPWDVQQQIIEISEEWAGLKSLPEMKFTLGGIEELQDPRVMLLYAIDQSGRVLGVTSWMPTYHNRQVIGWTLDFMRHRTDSPNGIMEFLIARMAERLRDESLKNPERTAMFMSLSAAPLAGMNDIEQSEDQASRNMITHTLAMLGDILEPAYGFQSLYFFKKKFQPTANPVYISYVDSARLAQISLAVTSSYLPETKPQQILEMVKTLRPQSKRS